MTPVSELVQQREFLIGLAAGVAVGIILAFIVCMLKCRNHSCTCKSGKKAQPLPIKNREPLEIPPGAVEIYVGNLSYDTDDESLKQAFSKFGEVSDARIITNRVNGRSKGFGFVIMPNRAEAEKAISEMHGHNLHGRDLRVNEAKNNSNF